jgi:hypothetical protein
MTKGNYERQGLSDRLDVAALDGFEKPYSASPHLVLYTFADNHTVDIWSFLVALLSDWEIRGATGNSWRDGTDLKGNALDS